MWFFEANKKIILSKILIETNSGPWESVAMFGSGFWHRALGLALSLHWVTLQLHLGATRQEAGLMADDPMAYHQNTEPGHPTWLKAVHVTATHRRKQLTGVT